MDGGEAVALVAAVIVAVLAGALTTALVALVRALRDLRAAVEALRDDASVILAEMAEVVTAAGDEVERVDRLVGSAERLESATDVAGRLAFRTLGSPVVKAMAFGTGVSRAAQRLREGEAEPPRDRARDVARRRRKGAKTKRRAS